MTVSPLINNVTEIKIKLHRKHTNRSWLEKIIKKKKKKKEMKTKRKEKKQ